jgi:methylmalonyl-CoA mutase C-terminal domain/subunit
MSKGKGIRVLITTIGLDDHFIGAEVVSTILRDAGMEVIYLGTKQTPEMIVQAAIQENVDIIGISCHGSNYQLIEEVIDLLKKRKMDDIPVICGGNIPKHHISRLKKIGVAEVFPPQSQSDSIINFIVSEVNKEKKPYHRDEES